MNLHQEFLIVYVNEIYIDMTQTFYVKLSFRISETNKNSNQMSIKRKMQMNNALFASN